MMTTTKERTVGQIAAQYPASVRIFEKYGIDFCCGGKIPVSDAFSRKGLDPAALVAEMELSFAGPAEDPTDWQTTPCPP